MDLGNEDLTILRLLQQDSRRSLRELARAAGVSAPTAAARVKALEQKGVVTGYPAHISPEALGERVVFLLLRASPKDAPALVRRLASRAEVRSVHRLGAGRVAAFASLIDPAAETEFLESLSSLGEVTALDSFPVLETSKSLPLAIVDRGVRFAVKCEFCGKRSKDEVVRVKVGDITHFVCCKSCKAGFLERVGRLVKLAGKSAARSDLHIVHD